MVNTVYYDDIHVNLLFSNILWPNGAQQLAPLSRRASRRLNVANQRFESAADKEYVEFVCSNSSGMSFLEMAGNEHLD